MRSASSAISSADSGQSRFTQARISPAQPNHEAVVVVKGVFILGFAQGQPGAAALFAHHLVQPVQKIHVPVGAEQHPAHFFVFLNEGE